MAEQQSIIGLDPTRGAAGERPAGVTAARPVSLEGAVVGLVSNQKSRATPFLERVFEELAGSHRLGGQVLVQKETVSSPPTPADWRRLKAEASVAIAGYGG
jgi:hypothetical protein